MTFLLFVAVVAGAAVLFLEAHPEVAQALDNALFGKDEDGEQDDARP